MQCNISTLYFICIQLWKKTGAWFTHDFEPYMDHAGCYHVHTEPWIGKVSAANKEEPASPVHSPLHSDSLSSATSETEFPADGVAAIKEEESIDGSGLPVCTIDDISPALAYCREFQCPQESFIISPEASSQMVNRLRGKMRKKIVHQAAMDVCDEDGASDTMQSSNVCLDGGVKMERSVSLPVASKQSENVLLHSVSQDRQDKKSRKERHSFVKSLSLRPMGSKQGRMKS